MTGGFERLLVVVADDLGLGREVDRGILDAHREGIVTAASALVVGPTAEAAAAAVAAGAPDLAVGVHLALVGPDGPASAPGAVPTLVGADGRFAASWRHLLPRLARGAVDPDEVRAEWRAQVARARELGLRPTHLDTHQHVHLWPGLARVLVDVARTEGIDVVRAPQSRRPGVGWGVGLLGSRLRRRLDAAGLRHPAAFAGWDHAGRHDAEAVVAALRRLAAGGARSAELGLHPGHPDPVAAERYGWGYDWPGELAAATSSVVREAVDRLGFTLVRPDELPAVRGG